MSREVHVRFLHAYVIIDLFSRYVVGWMVAAKHYFIRKCNLEDDEVWTARVSASSHLAYGNGNVTR